MFIGDHRYIYIYIQYRHIHPLLLVPQLLTSYNHLWLTLFSSLWPCLPCLPTGSQEHRESTTGPPAFALAPASDAAAPGHGRGSPGCRRFLFFQHWDFFMAVYHGTIKMLQNNDDNGTFWRHFFMGWTALFQIPMGCFASGWLRHPPGSRQSEPRPEPSHGWMPWFLSHKQIINRYGYGHKEFYYGYEYMFSITQWYGFIKFSISVAISLVTHAITSRLW